MDSARKPHSLPREEDMRVIRWMQFIVCVAACTGEVGDLEQDDDVTELDEEVAVTEQALGQDGKVTLRFHNRCAHAVVVGRTWDAPFATLAPGEHVDRTLGPDNRPYPSLTYYAA